MPTPDVLPKHLRHVDTVMLQRLHVLFVMEIQTRAVHIDRDSKFTAAFDGVFTGNGTRMIKIPVRAP